MKKWKMKVLVAQLYLTLCDPMDYSPSGSSVHGDSPGKHTGLGCHGLLQEIFPTQELNPGLLHFLIKLFLGCSLTYPPSTCGDGLLKLSLVSLARPSGFNMDISAYSVNKYRRVTMSRHYIQSIETLRTI